jgi:hypothetical protein
MTKRSGLLAVLAHCVTCGWESEARNAAGNAARHAAATGHHVQVEQTVVTIYNSDRLTPPDD